MICVDPLTSCIPNARWRFTESCHLMCEPGEEDQLHEVAAAIGLLRKWYQRSSTAPHYDLNRSKRELVLIRGLATEITREQCGELLKRWRDYKGVKTQNRAPLTHH